MGKEHEGYVVRFRQSGGHARAVNRREYSLFLFRILAPDGMNFKLIHERADHIIRAERNLIPRHFGSGGLPCHLLFKRAALGDKELYVLSVPLRDIRQQFGGGNTGYQDVFENCSTSPGAPDAFFAKSSIDFI